MATLDWEKGIKEYLETLVEVCKNNKTIKFLVVGDGPQLLWAKEFVKKTKLVRRVRFIGYQENYKKYLASMNILLSPINFRGALSLSVQEAMSMGVVPIVTDIGGNKELVINGVTGYIFSNLYTKKACRLILMLLRDQDLLQKISTNARKHIEDNFSIRQFVRQWYTIVYNLVS